MREMLEKVEALWFSAGVSNSGSRWAKISTWTKLPANIKLNFQTIQQIT